MCMTGGLLGVGLCNGNMRAINWRQVGWIYFGWIATIFVSRYQGGSVCLRYTEMLSDRGHLLCIDLRHHYQCSKASWCQQQLKLNTRSSYCKHYYTVYRNSRRLGCK